MAACSPQQEAVETVTGTCPLPMRENLVFPGLSINFFQNYRTISLISNPSKVMLKIILNRLKPEAEQIIAEEQAGFRPGRSSTEQIFNLRILCERYLQHQQDLYHVFIDFKKVFDGVWHPALWATMKLYNINTNLINAIQNLYDKATSAVCFNGSTEGWFRTSRSKTGLSALTHPLQHILGEYHG